MLATSADALPRGDGWSYEVKWDGYRTLILKNGARVQLLSRNLKDATRQYPTVARAALDLEARQVLVDGEVVALDADGRPSFQALHHQQSAHTLVYYAFDLLHVDGRDLMRAPLDERRTRLAPLLAPTPLLHSEPLPGRVEQIERAVRGLGLEGVVAKRGDSIYEPGRRSRSWLKVKFNRHQEFVVGGYKPNATGFESLLVGYHDDDGGLRYAGKVRAGLTAHARVQLFPRLRRIEIDRCPFVDLPSSRTSHWGEGVDAEEMAMLRWVRPQPVVEVSFVEWTRDGHLRHAEFVAIREDKLPSEVRRHP
jgi:bifunctional non-homologous end joining protein LigD